MKINLEFLFFSPIERQHYCTHKKTFTNKINHDSNKTIQLFNECYDMYELLIEQQK